MSVKIRIWFEYPFAGTENPERIITYDDGFEDRHLQHFAEEALMQLYNDEVPGGWEIIKDTGEDK